MKNKIFFLYIAAVFCLFLYSFTQVDLNLTLSKITFWFALQDFWQNIGYFNRPLSSAIYLFLILFLLFLYLFILKKAQKKEISLKQFWVVVLVSSFILIFSYPAFSYDIFNYMFDARIVTKYAQNPYFHKALDYPQDPWTNFMRWTHRLYPYGPLWIVLTIPLSFLGLAKFLPTLYLFKLLMTSCYLGTIYFLQKILKRVGAINLVSALCFFAFNPLVVVESLISGHNDIVMMFLSVVALYFLWEKKYFFSILFLFLSSAVKFATIILLPLFILKIVLDRSERKISFDRFITITVILMVLAVLAASFRTQFQPWYLLFVLSFVPFLAGKKYFSRPAVIISFGSLFIYLPYLYLGNWDPPVPLILNLIMLASLFFAIISVAAVPFWQKNEK